MVTLTSNLETENPDYPDWLGPFLVKELRQLLRSRRYAIALMWVQMSNALMVMSRTATAVGMQHARPRSLSFTPFTALQLIGTDVLYWGNLVLLLHFFLPFRHLISQDEDANRENLELLRLTGLETSKLATSKFLASGAISLLLVTSLLPYSVIRYFIGRVDVVNEIMVVGWLWINGLVFGALGILVGSRRRTGRFFWGAALLFLFPIGEVLCWGVIDVWKNPHPYLPLYVIWSVVCALVVSLSLSLAFDGGSRFRSIILPEG